MNTMTLNLATAIGLATVALATGARAQTADPNFHIYLAFGQSNMEGNSKDFNATDKVANPRFQILSAVTCSSPARTKDQWSAGIAPVARCNTGLTPVDYFARTLVDSLPSSVRIGIVQVAVAGSKIEGFNPSTYASYYASEATWMQNIVKEYGGNPYARLVAMAKTAQKSGIIKGILLHQGESNSGDASWPTKVNAIYTSLLKDLGLQAKQVPLLAGELVNSDQGGACAGHNAIIAKLPQTVPTSYVISSKGCPAASDKLHFTSDGYRTLGKRYAVQMLKLLPSTTSISAGTAGLSGAAADQDVFDIRGGRVATLHGTDARTRGFAWEQVRQSLPVGIYWMRNLSNGEAWKLVNSR